MFKTAPFVSTVDAEKHIVSCAYDFSADPIRDLSILGAQVSGTSFQVNLGTIGATQLKRMKALRFTACFASATDGDNNDGDIYILSQGTGELTAISGLLPTSGPLSSGDGGFDVAYPIVSGCIPISLAENSTITIFKTAYVPGGVATLFGAIALSFYDYEQQPFLISGFSATPFLPS
jgi:hypothetical protein